MCAAPTWTTTGPGAPPSLDFLTILLQSLADRGLSFSVAATSHNLNVGPVPLLLCSGQASALTCLGTTVAEAQAVAESLRLQ